MKSFREFSDLGIPLTEVFGDNAQILNESLIQLANQKDSHFGQVVIMAGGAGCYPADTEYFTGSGWKPIKDYKKGDNVLVYDKDTGTAFLSADVKHIKLKTDQFYRIKNRRVDFTTSETHKHLLVSEKGYMSDKTTLELVEQHDTAVRGNKQKLFTSFNYIGGRGLNLSNDAIRLCVAIIADGYVMLTLKNGLSRIRFSFAKERKINRARGLLELNGIPYREYKSGKHTRFEFLLDFKEKEFTPEWYHASVNQMKVIADEVLEWGGCKNSNSFSTTSKQSADYVQFIWSALGYDVTLEVDSREGRNECYSVQRNDSFGRGISKSATSDNTTTIEKVEAGDKMYCFTTETGYFVVRQKGQIYVSGNSGKGLIINNLVDIKGRIFDVDALKMMVRNQEEVRKKVRERLGKNVDIDSPNFLKNPEHTSAIHMVVKELDYEERFKKAQWNSIMVADKSRLPNLLFDITMKKPKDLDEVCDKVVELGYKKENIHIVWVLNTMEVAYQNNLKRERVVGKEIFIDTHHGAAETMATIVKMGEKLRAKMDGNMVVAFNRTVIDGKNDVAVVKGKGGTNIFGKKAKPMYIDSAFYRYLKRKGQAPKSPKELEKEILLAIQERVSAEKLNAWFGE